EAARALLSVGGKQCNIDAPMPVSRALSPSILLLLGAEFFVCSTAPTQNGDTCLMTAIQNHSLQMVQLLVEHGADPSACNLVRFQLLQPPLGRSSKPVCPDTPPIPTLFSSLN